MRDQSLRYAVKMFYDLQRIRIQIGGRILAVENPQGIELENIDIEFFKSEFDFIYEREKQFLKYIKKQLKKYAIWTEFLEKVKGIGETMGAVILSEYDIEKADTVSKLWSFTGLNVVDGKAPKPIKGEKLKYNKWLRSKMVGVLGSSFLKCNSPYRQYYDNYKNRLVSANWGQSDGHRHNAAIRYMIKMFLIDLYKNWRSIEGLTVREPYQNEYLNHIHKVA
jgi:hypothetical protein